MVTEAELRCADRVDRVSLNPAAALAREALALTPEIAPQRRAVLTEAAAVYDFLAARLPEVTPE